MGKIYLNDVGTRFEVTTKDDGIVVDISGATTKQILFKKPSGSLLTKNGDFTTDGTDGKLEYSVITDDLNEVGVWKIQTKIILGGGVWSSEIEMFEVFQTLS